MGCDIHIYIEYKPKRSKAWSCFGGGINPGRDYSVFEVLAGVRGNINTLFKPKGLPEDVSFIVEDENSLIISDELSDEEGYCSKETAESWIKLGISYYLDEDKRRVSHPDWHSHSWLSLEEYDKALKYLDYETYPGYYVLKAMLETFEEKGYQSRLIFWFDN